MGTKKKFTRAIAFLIAIVMIVSLSPLNIVAEILHRIERKGRKRSGNKGQIRV